MSETQKILRFAICGAVVFVIDYGTLMFLTQVLHLRPDVATPLSFIFATLINYEISKRYVFKSDKNTLPSFIALSIVGLVISEATVILMTSTLGTTAPILTASKVTSTAIAMVFNYLTRRYLLFKK